MQKKRNCDTLGSSGHKKWPIRWWKRVTMHSTTKCQQCPWANDSGFFSISLFITKGQLPLWIMRLKRKRNLQGVIHKWRFFLYFVESPRIQDTKLTMQQKLICVALWVNSQLRNPHKNTSAHLLTTVEYFKVVKAWIVRKNRYLAHCTPTYPLQLMMLVWIMSDPPSCQPRFFR